MPPALMPADVASAFLDLDKKQGMAQAAVDALSPGASQSIAIGGEWGAVREVCYAASAAYIELAAIAENATDGEELQARVSAVAQHIDDARRAIEAFYERHSRPLDDAKAAASAGVALSEQALAEAHTIRRRFEAAKQIWRSYPSVQEAHHALEACVADLHDARTHGNPTVVRASIDELNRSAAALESALDNAPRRAEQARHAVASIHTRVEAARTRAAGISETMSSLLREFHADSSSDLLGNERQARTSIDSVAMLMTQATAEVAEGRPEPALDLVAQARAALAVTDELIDAATDRLAMLREIRQDPKRAERDVRFRLRDAQQLAVDRGAAGEWGSALDAQVARLDRIVETLANRNPDYWRYRIQLQEVSDFIRDIVDRIRQRSAQ